MITAEEARAELLRRRAQTDLLACMAYCWWMPTPLKVGRHTRETCARLTRAVHDYIKAGQTTYLLVNMPFRHGKSDMVSRALPAFFLGVCNAAGIEPNVIMSGYGASLIEGFSDKVQDIMRSDAYKRVFPGISIPTKASAAEWKLNGSQSTVYATGLGGSLTGKGGNLIIVDDYCKNREEAESKPVREKMWNSFKDDLSTRMNAGGGIVVVCATRWHDDDISGRIKKNMRDNPDYPQYEELVFPAKKEGEGGWDILFPELYDEKWYRTYRVTLGPYSSAALLDCNPTTPGTLLFSKSWLHFYSNAINKSRMVVHIFVDGAKSKASTADFTTVLVIGRGSDGCYYLLDGVHARLNLQEKISEVFRLCGKWRPKRVWWEQVGAMSDVEALRMEMDREMFHFNVTELNHNTNKDYRIRKLVVPFSQGVIYLPNELKRVRTSSDGNTEPYDLVNEFVEDEFSLYSGPESTKHDDMIDCLADIMDDVVLKEFTPPRDGADGGSREAEKRQQQEVRNSIFAR